MAGSPVIGPSQFICRMTRTTAALAVVVVLACNEREGPASSAALSYPVTRTVAVVDTYHGTPVTDPYRWLEQLDAPEVREWAAAQHTLARSVLRQDAFRDRLIQRMQHYGKAWDQFEDDAPDAVVQGFEYRRRPAPGAAYQRLHIRKADGDDSSRVLIDPRDFGDGRSLARFQVSPDGRYVAYAISNGGSEWVETRFRRVSDGVDLPDVLTGMLGGVPLWSRDSRGVFYVHHRRDAERRVMFLEPAVRYHAIGGEQSADRMLFATPPGSVESVVQISYASDGRYLVVSEGSGAVWGSFSWVLSRMHLMDLGEKPTPTLANPLRAITSDKIAGYQVIASDGPTLYVLTDRAAPRKRLVMIDARDPAPDQWQDVVLEDETLVLHAMRRINGRFVGVYLRDVQPLIRVFSTDGRLVRSFELPSFSNVMELDGGESTSELVALTASFLQPPTQTTFDVVSGATRVKPLFSSDFHTASYRTTQESYTSKDGTRVPMFLVHRKDIALDGSHAVLMHGYGASGTVMLPEFSEDVLAWLEAGGVFAMPSLRGGGEFGRAWYEAAIMSRKQTTIDDFIAAAEWLIASGYTTSQRLAIRGASNGGQLVSATITQRPDLFGAAIAEVPITDNLRYDRGRHRGQFGHASDSTQFESLLSYSPLHRVKPGTCYPATLITTVMNDDRVPSWHAFKFTAALQAAQSCQKPVLLRVEDVGGHAGDRGPDSWMEDAADAYAFAAHHVGLKLRLTETPPTP